MKKLLWVIVASVSFGLVGCGNSSEQTVVTPAATEASTEDFNAAVEKAVAAALETYESKESSTSAYSEDPIPPTVTEPATEAPASNSYILDFTNSRLVTNDDLAELTKEGLRLARNEIYARHGYVFNSQDLKDYFSEKLWYRPDASFNESQLSSVEKDNVARIKSYEANNTVESSPMKLVDGEYFAANGNAEDSILITNNGTGFYYIYSFSDGSHPAEEYGEGSVSPLGNNQYSLEFYETDEFGREYYDTITMTSNGFYSSTLGKNLEFLK
ncbi:YARHG domain-containing protein [Hungatella effluvii]|uniref:YARHG domain-containing protein n=1 Tax=Hungatella effluvii TaxID=1096246 RepID=UPI0022E192D1|nr:YARHG domain-containing protein [Hungatella effluvii]